MKVNKRHLDNKSTMVIVDNYYKIFNRAELENTNNVPSHIIEEVLARGLKFDKLIEDLNNFGDFKNEE